jgi:hypothetical protein
MRRGVSEAADCRTRETEPWRMVSRIRSAEHVHRSRATELARDKSLALTAEDKSLALTGERVSEDRQES